MFDDKLANTNKAPEKETEDTSAFVHFNNLTILPVEIFHQIFFHLEEQEGIALFRFKRVSKAWQIQLSAISLYSEVSFLKLLEKRHELIEQIEKQEKQHKNVDNENKDVDENTTDVPTLISHIQSIDITIKQISTQIINDFLIKEEERKKDTESAKRSKLIKNSSYECQPTIVTRELNLAFPKTTNPLNGACPILSSLESKYLFFLLNSCEFGEIMITNSYVLTVTWFQLAGGGFLKDLNERFNLIAELVLLHPVIRSFLLKKFEESFNENKENSDKWDTTIWRIATKITSLESAKKIFVIPELYKYFIAYPDWLLRQLPLFKQAYDEIAPSKVINEMLIIKIGSTFYLRPLLPPGKIVIQNKVDKTHDNDSAKDQTGVPDVPQATQTEIPPNKNTTTDPGSDISWRKALRIAAITLSVCLLILGILLCLTGAGAFGGAPLIFLASLHSTSVAVVVTDLIIKGLIIETLGLFSMIGVFWKDLKGAILDWCGLNRKTVSPSNPVPPCGGTFNQLMPQLDLSMQNVESPPTETSNTSYTNLITRQRNHGSGQLPQTQATPVVQPQVEAPTNNP